jgi:hypothetical protein
VRGIARGAAEPADVSAFAMVLGALHLLIEGARA